MERLKRKIDNYLIKWKNNSNKLPLIIKGARQIGKTNAIRNFGENNYKTFVEINFALQPQFKTIFEEGFEVDNIIKNIFSYKITFFKKYFILFIYRSCAFRHVSIKYPFSLLL